MITSMLNLRRLYNIYLKIYNSNLFIYIFTIIIALNAIESIQVICFLCISSVLFTFIFLKQNTYFFIDDILLQTEDVKPCLRINLARIISIFLIHQKLFYNILKTPIYNI